MIQTTRTPSRASYAVSTRYKQSSIPGESVAFFYEPKCDNVSRRPSFMRVSTWFGQTLRGISDLKFARENVNGPWSLEMAVLKGVRVKVIKTE